MAPGWGVRSDRIPDTMVRGRRMIMRPAGEEVVNGGGPPQGGVADAACGTRGRGNHPGYAICPERGCGVPAPADVPAGPSDDLRLRPEEQRPDEVRRHAANGPATLRRQPWPARAGLARPGARVRS